MTPAKTSATKSMTGKPKVLASVSSLFILRSFGALRYGRARPRLRCSVGPLNIELGNRTGKVQPQFAAARGPIGAFERSPGEGHAVVVEPGDEHRWAFDVQSSRARHRELQALRDSLEEDLRRAVVW